MVDVPISLTCADYARVMPLATGDVKPDGIALTLIHGTGGSWESRAEMRWRAICAGSKPRHRARRDQ